MLSYGISWLHTTVNEVARMRCAHIHPSFGYGPAVTRQCLDGGVWDTPDMSQCSIGVNANPLIIFSTFLETTDAQNTAEKFTMMVSSDRSDFNEVVYILINLDNEAVEGSYQD